MRAIVLLALLGVSGFAADWLMSRGDPQRSGVQPRERFLNKDTVSKMKLLWKRQLDPNLTTPTMQGPIVTHRGIKEIVFVASRSGDVYAIDADLGRLLWTRQLSSSPGACGGLTAAPAIPPAPPGYENAEFAPMRPVYFVSSDGKLHALRATYGEEVGAPRPFLPPNSNASDLILDGAVLSATTSGQCGGSAGTWRIDVRRTDAAAEFQAGVEEVRELPPVSANGVRYLVSDGRLVALDADTGKQLYASPKLNSEPSGGIAIANGHVCFGMKDGMLYCFAFPIEM